MPPVNATTMSKLIIVIFILALFLRIYKLDTFPLGFHVDEAKVAWESLSILKTGKDDHGNLLNLYYNSFGDYRPTGIFYITIPSLIVFGKTNFAVRFMSALFGALTVFPIYLIAELITKNKKTGIFAALILAIIPWDIATSRATSEVVISSFFIISSMALLRKRPIISFIFLISSFLFYHSARVIGPVLMFTWIIYLLSQKKVYFSKKIIIGFFISSLFSLYLLLSPTGMARYNQVKLVSPNLRSIIVNYSSYFDPNFLIGDIAKPFRYTTTNVGIVSIPIFVCFLLGIFVSIKTNKNKILLFALAIGPIPASLTLEDSPNLHRAFFMLPFLGIIAGIGLTYLWENHKNVFKIMTFCIVWSLISFCVSYLSTQNNLAFQYRDPQTKRLSIYIASVQNNYSKIYVTNDPDSPYPWYGFFNNINPKDLNKALQKGVDGKWQFKNFIWDNTKCPAGVAFNEAKKDKSIKKIMVIDNGECFTDYKEKASGEAKIIKEFMYIGKVNYRVWEYEPTRS
jgi:4-amino-4-deoxy-L-arabinose transferase-like glycosyltransferase